MAPRGPSWLHQPTTSRPAEPAVSCTKQLVGCYMQLTLCSGRPLRTVTCRVQLTSTGLSPAGGFIHRLFHNLWKARKPVEKLWKSALRHAAKLSAAGGQTKINSKSAGQTLCITSIPGVSRLIFPRSFALGSTNNGIAMPLPIPGC